MPEKYSSIQIRYMVGDRQKGMVVNNPATIQEAIDIAKEALVLLHPDYEDLTIHSIQLQ